MAKNTSLLNSVQCHFCKKILEDPNEYQIDEQGQGFWCEYCDGYTYLDNTIKHNFLLILEEKAGKQDKIPYSKPTIKLNKRLSFALSRRKKQIN